MNYTEKLGTDIAPAPLTVADVKHAAMAALVRVALPRLKQGRFERGVVGLVLGDTALVVLQPVDHVLKMLKHFNITLTEKQAADLTPEAQATRDAEGYCLIVVTFMGEVAFDGGDRCLLTGDHDEYAARMNAKYGTKAVPAASAN